MNIVIKKSFLALLLLSGSTLHPIDINFNSFFKPISHGFNTVVTTIVERPKTAILTVCAVIGATSLYKYLANFKKHVTEEQLSETSRTSIINSGKMVSQSPLSASYNNDDLSGSVLQNLFDERNQLDKAFESHLFYPMIEDSDASSLDFSMIDDGTHGYENNRNEIVEIDGEQWLALDEKVKLKTSFKNYSFMKKLVKPSLRDKGKIAFLCVHGTFSSPNKFSVNSENENSRYLLQFANRLAEAKQKAVEVIAFKWSAQLSLDARKDAAKVLARMLSDEVGNDSDEVWAYAHSHGCNVVSLAAQKYYNKLASGKNFETIVYCASPAPDFEGSDDDFSDQTLNQLAYANNVYHFYGSSDVTQALGSYESKGTWERKLPISNSARVHNIRLMAGTEDLDHANIKHHVSKNLHKLLAVIDSWYPYHYDLDASVSDESSLPYVGIRHLDIHNPDVSEYKRELSIIRSEEQRKIFAERFGQDLSHNIHNIHPRTSFLRMVYNEHSSRKAGY